MSSIIKAAVFGASWFFLPAWFFLTIGLYFYLFPVFGFFRMLLPFAVVIFLALTEEPNLWFAAVLAALFYLILAIKNFQLVKREPAHETLSLLLLFALFIRFFSVFDGESGLAPVFFSLLIAATAFFLFKGVQGGHSTAATGNGVVLAVYSLLILQLLPVLLFLPLNFVYQSVIALVFAAVSFSLISGFIRGGLTRRGILVSFSTFLVFCVIILGAAQWGL